MSSSETHTAIGAIPTEWQATALAECVHPDAPICYGILMPGEHCARGVPVVKVRDIVDGKIDESNLLLTRPEIDEAFKRSRLQQGDVLITIRGSTGRVAIVQHALNGANITQDTARARIRPEHCNAFVYHALQSSAVQKQIALHTIGQAVKGINIRDVKNLILPLPRSLKEQEAISATLDAVDALLSTLEQLIVKKRYLKQAAMQQLLTSPSKGGVRLPGFRGEWQGTTLGEIGECIIGLTYKPENVVDHGLLVLRSSNIRDGRLSYDDNVYVNAAVPARLITRVGDLLICVRNGSRSLIGKCAIIDNSASGLTFGAFMSIYRSEHNLYLAHAFQSHTIQRQIRDNIGATINQITNKDMRALRLDLPCRDEQLAIASVLSDMEAELTALEQRHRKYGALKRAMMKELLTGTTRLVPTEFNT